MNAAWQNLRSLQALWLPMLLALPVLGLVSGPLYAPLVFGPGCALALAAALRTGRFPAVDRPLAALALAFATLSWVGTVWSIVPAHTAAAAGQITLILTAALAVLALPPPEAAVCRAVLRPLPWAIALGVGVLCLDRAAHHNWDSWFHADITKYSRGLDYLVLLAWPLLAHAVAERDQRRALALGLLMAVAVSVGVSTTGNLALVAGAGVLILAALLPAAAPAALFGLLAALVATLPFILRAFAGYREALAPYLKSSGFHRLEIWDYMSARILEQPLLGWGLLSAKSVPIRPEELAAYHYVDASGIYPHNQWLELWLETGAAGAALALGFVALVLWRIRRTLPAGMQPFAYAACGSALTISWLNFEITTDSWWAALTASALLFKLVSVPLPPRSGAACGSPAS